MRSSIVALLLVGSACSREPNSSSSPAPTAVTPGAPAAAVAPPATEAAPTLGTSAEAGPLAWEHHAPLLRRTPKSAMRAAEYGVEGDPSAELSVFFFGPNQGGDVESNVQRWVGQLRSAADAAPPKRSTRAVGPVTVHLVEAAGAFGGGMGMPGMPAPAPIDDALMLGAIAEAPASAEGPVRVFFKFVGPRASVERARDAFGDLVGSIHTKP